MENFSYYNPVKLLYGAGTVDQVAQEILPYGKRVLLVYGQRHLKQNGDYDRIVKLLKDAGIEWIELPGVKPNPKLYLVEHGVQICKQEKIDFILAVGGGSVSDAAKAISMGAKMDYDVWQAYEDFHHQMHGGSVEEFPHVPTSTVPFGVVMTKPATGSEFDYTSVLSNPNTCEKLMVINKTLYAKFSIHDPTLTYTLPHDESAYGTADIMTHLFEQYLTTTTNTEILDRFHEGMLKTTIERGRQVQDNMKDYVAQSELLYVAAWACSDQSMCGNVGGWASHMMEHEVSALTDINHGHGMAIIFIPWMKYVLEAIPEKFARYGEQVWGIDRRGRSDVEVGQEAIERTADYWKSLGITLTWKDVNIPQSVLKQAAGQAVRFGPLMSPKELKEEDVFKIYQMAA